MSRQSNLQAGNTPHRVAYSDALRDGKVRRHAVDLYARAAADWGRAPGVLSRGFRGARELRSHERRFVGEAVYGMIRWRRRLAWLATGLDDATPPELYVAWLDQEYGRMSDADGRIDTIVDPIARLGVRESMPDWLVRRLVGEHGETQTAALLEAMNRRAPLTVRANRLKNTRDELAERLRAEKVGSHAITLAPDALVLETHVNAYGLTAFREGRFELQDAGSQLIAELTAPPPRSLVVDACAGAGGKTLALGALLGNKGRLYALEPSARKLDELRERARRAGLTNVQAIEVPEIDQPLGDRVDALVGRADRVLCDVPCSGVGVLRRNPEARWRLTERDLDELPRVQAAILERYASLAAPGGRLVYATCTVTARENDAVVDAFLERHPEFQAVAAKEILGGERARAIGDGERLRLWPQVHDTDGFFAAVLRKRP